MTTMLTRIDQPRPGETWPKAIARRLRGEFAQRSMPMTKVAKLVGLSQSQFSRRMTGALPFDVAELDVLCTALGIDRDYILTGASSLLAQPAESLLLPRVDSNHEPAGEYLDTFLAAASGE